MSEAMLKIFNSLPKVAIALPTFNGLPYIIDQIQSIEAQELVQPDIFVRDDGSTDGTINTLTLLGYQNRMIFDELGRIGVTANLLEIMKYIEDYEYLAFSDQDDIWEPSHLRVAISGLENEKPCAYFARYRTIDDMGKPKSIIAPVSFMNIRNALVENPVIGCGIVLNRKSIELLKSLTLTATTYLDWQIYFITSCVGSIVQGKEIQVNYRIHKKNTVGVKRFPTISSLLEFNKFLRSIRQAQDDFEFLFLQLKKYMDEENRRNLDIYFQVRRKNIVHRGLYCRKVFFKRSKKRHHGVFLLLFIFFGF